MHDSSSHALRLHDLPLGFLPAFEAAGRLGSFAAAASELHLTPSAIRQQIRTLENMLGVALFERNGRAAVLTADGKRYLCEVREALSTLAVSTARLRRRTQGTVLRLQTMALAQHEFLLPRLASFRARFPALELRIETSNDIVDFRHTDCDAALRFGNGWPDLTVKTLGNITVTMVCAPELAAEIRRTSDLHRYTLLDANGEAQRGFAAIMSAAGLPTQASKIWSFETCQETLRAAESGMGIALGVFPLATHWITSGRLVVPLADRVRPPGDVCFVYRPLDEARFPFADLSDWFQTEYARLPALASGRIVHGRRAGAA